MKTTKLFFLASMLSSGIFAQTLEDAIKLTINEQYETAATMFKEVTLQNSNGLGGENYFYSGENYFKNDNLDLADSMYQKGVYFFPTNPLCYVGLGKIQWNKGKQAEAKANFFKARTLAKTYKYQSSGTKTVEIRLLGKGSGTSVMSRPLNSEGTVLMKIAEAYINAENKNIEEASSLLEEALKLEPYNPDIYITRGDAYLEQNDGTKAIEYYEKAASLDPKSVIATLRQGQLYNRAKNFPLALDFYKKASLIDSSFAPAYREKAEIYFRAGQYNNAVAQYKRYLQLNNNCSARGRYAGFLNQAKQFKESVDAALEAQKCNPDNIYLNRYLAYDYLELKDCANGLTNINAFFSKAKPETKIITLDYETRAKLNALYGNDSLAIIDFKKALELDTTKKDLNNDIANSLIKMKRFPEAIDLYKKKIAGGKANANDYFGIGRAYYYSKDFINADSSFTQIIKLQPDLYLGYLWRAKTNVQLDPKNEKWLAKPFYEVYLSKLKPEELALPQNKNNLIDTYTYLGVYFINHKDNCAAKTQFKKVQELDSSNTNAKKFLDSAEAKKCQ